MLALAYAVQCLRHARVRYAIIGAWALSLWGKPRATADLDFLVLVKGDRLEHLAAVLTSSGMELDRLWQQWNPLLRGSQLRLQYRGATIDLLLPRDQHDEAIFRRVKKKRVAGKYYWVVSLEDFILQKIKVGRPRDFEDAVSVVERFREERSWT
jgi:predicted nucleotidyltransferase